MAGVTAEPFELLDEPVLDESVLDESVLDESVLDEPVVPETVPLVLLSDESVLDESVPDESVLDEPVPDESVLNESVLDVSGVWLPLSASVVVAVVPETLVASVSAHSCRPSADAAITAATPTVVVMMVASLLPLSCRFIFRAAFLIPWWVTNRAGRRSR